jgi:acetylornithine deacetylase/succinyl-diaminopimelate desuccinylase-like protein
MNISYTYVFKGKLYLPGICKLFQLWIIYLTINIPLNCQEITQQMAFGVEYIKNQKDIAALQLINIGSIISPSGEEEERAEAVAAEMNQIGLSFIEVDPWYNVIGILPGEIDSCLVLISTLDDLASVARYQREADRSLYREGDRIEGPGSNTSSTTVAMLMAAKALNYLQVKPKYTLVFAGVSREETGLEGMKKIYSDWKEKSVGFVDILGEGTLISYGAMGIHWWKVLAVGPPGHSLSGGTPNTNQGISRAIDRILSINISEDLKSLRTIVNIAMIQSGEVFNHKPKEGWFSLDIRSLDPEVIRFLEDTVQQILQQVNLETGIHLVMEPYQLTPGGQYPDAINHRLVTTAIRTGKYLGMEPTLHNAGSSNLNIPLANGKMAIGINGDRGGNRGYPDEWADLNALIKTAQFVYLLCLLY